MCHFPFSPRAAPSGSLEFAHLLISPTLTSVSDRFTWMGFNNKYVPHQSWPLLCLQSLTGLRIFWSDQMFSVVCLSDLLLGDFLLANRVWNAKRVGKQRGATSAAGLRESTVRQASCSPTSPGFGFLAWYTDIPNGRFTFLLVSRSWEMLDTWQMMLVHLWDPEVPPMAWKCSWKSHSYRQVWEDFSLTGL